MLGGDDRLAAFTQVQIPISQWRPIGLESFKTRAPFPFLQKKQV
jgi:hypothetical protein